MSIVLPTHPDTGLTALGLTKGGAPIWPVLGGNGEGDGNTGDDAPPAGDDTGDGDGGDNVDQDGADLGDGTGDEDTPGSDPAGSQSSDPAMRKARNEAARYRTEKAALEQQLAEAKKATAELAALKQSLGKSLGYVEDEEAPDPKALAAKLDTAAQKAKASQTQLAVFRLAGKKGVDAEALLDSRSFLDAVDKLDPEADDFASLVGAEITKAAEKNPRYKVTPATPPPPGRSGGDTGSGQGEASGQLTYAQYQALPPVKRIEAVKAGRCASFLGSK